MRIRGQSDIEVFVADNGYICLRQDDVVDGSKVIEFAPAYGTKVVDAISQLRAFAQAQFEKAELVDE